MTAPAGGPAAGPRPGRGEGAAAVWAGQGKALARGPGPPLSPWRCRGHRPDRLGDNDGMASDDSWALARRLYRMVFLDGVRPRGRSDGCPLSPPSLPRPPSGRALGFWPPAAGPGSVGKRCWFRAGGVGPLHGSAGPGRAGQLAARAWRTGPGCRRADAPTARRRSRDAWQNAASAVAWMIIGVPWGLRHPRRLTVLAIAMEAPNVVFYVVRAAWAVQRRRPRIAAGSALAAAGSVARLRAAAAEPLR